MSGDSTTLKLKSSQSNRRVFNQQPSIDDNLSWIPESVTTKYLELKATDENEKVSSSLTTVEIAVQRETPSTPPATSSFLSTSVSTTIITTSSSADALNNEGHTLNLLSGPSSPSNLSSITLVGSTGSGSTSNVTTSSQEGQNLFKYTRAPSSPLPERKRKPEQTVDSNANETNPSGNGTKISQISTSSDATTTTITSKPTDTVSSRPTIVSAIVKTSTNKENGNRSASPARTINKITSNVLQPNMNYLTQNRRPSTGTIGVPMAALIQHRHSLQMNSSEGGFGFGHKVSNWMTKRELIFKQFIIIFGCIFQNSFRCQIEVVPAVVADRPKHQKKQRKASLEEILKKIHRGM